MVARLTLAISAIGLLVALTGCSTNIADYDCNDLKSEAVRISKGAIVKITQSYEVSRTPSELVCKGSGFYSSGDTILTRYRAWADEDGDIMVAWDTKEAQEAAEAQEQRENDTEVERASQSFNAAVDAAFGTSEH